MVDYLLPKTPNPKCSRIQNFLSIFSLPLKFWISDLKLRNVQLACWVVIEMVLCVCCYKSVRKVNSYISINCEARRQCIRKIKPSPISPVSFTVVLSVTMSRPSFLMSKCFFFVPNHGSIRWHGLLLKHLMILSRWRYLLKNDTYSRKSGVKIIWSVVAMWPWSHFACIFQLVQNSFILFSPYKGHSQWYQSSTWTF